MTPAEYARMRKRESTGGLRHGHPAIEPVQVELAWVARLAGAACGMLALGIAVRVYAFYSISIAISDMELNDPNDTEAVIASITQVTSGLGGAADWLFAANALFVFGTASAVFALRKYRYRAPWFGITLVCLAFLYLFVPVLGTLFAIFYLWYHLQNRRSFSSPAPVLPSSVHEAY
jgi:hypothetical protein